MTSDAELLARYVNERSQTAFAEIVARHLDLVYASARRQLGNHDAAQDIAQAVFLMLATKASSLRANVILTGWLMTATWYACRNANRKERRRRIHESGVAAMRNEKVDSSAELPDAQIDHVLDKALMALGATDRAAVTMHFLQSRSFGEMAIAMRITPEAARKRTERALLKLRKRFAKAGVEFASPAAVGTSLAGAASMKASPGLLAEISSLRVADEGIRAIAGSALQSMSIAAKVKIVAAFVAVALVMGGVSAVIMSNESRVAVAAGTAILPQATTAPSPLVPVDVEQPIVAGSDAITFPNIVIAPIGGSNLTQFTYGQDVDIKRQSQGEPSVYIASTVPAGLMPGMRGWNVSAEAWRGKRLEVSAYLRTQDVQNATGMNVIVWGEQNLVVAGDIDGGRLRVAGTSDWKRMSSVLDVPIHAQRIEFGIGLWGPGRVWIDSFTLASVPNTTPLTSDSAWHLSTEFPSRYSLTNDVAAPRNGHATARMQFSGSLGKESAKFIRIERTVEPFRGKRIRLRAMIKSESVTRAGVFASAGGFDAKRRFAQHSTKADLPIRGTTGWLEYCAVLDVPEDADFLEYGVLQDGSGTLWIDDVAVEVVLK